MRPVAIAVCTGIGALVIACSSEGVSTDPSIPHNTAFFVDYTTSWSPAGDLGDTEATTVAELRAAEVFAIVPPDSPDWQDSIGELRISRSGPAPDLIVDVVVRLKDGDVTLSAKGNSVANPPSCQDRLDGFGGEESWQLVNVRGTAGCMATNPVGLSFIEWTEGDLWWHAETRMEPLEALDWLTEWIVLT